MKAILMSINAIHNANIESGDKTNELRTRPPKIEPPFKVYTYESGALGRHKVVNEWICDSMTTWLIYMGIPAHLITTGCISAEYISKYTDNGKKDLTAMHISSLVIYDKPRELSEFKQVRAIRGYHKKDEPKTEGINIQALLHSKRVEVKYFTRPPQSWAYTESEEL